MTTELTKAHVRISELVKEKYAMTGSQTMMTIWSVTWRQGRSMKVHRCFFTNADDAQRWVSAEWTKRRFRDIAGPMRHTLADGVNSVVTLLNIYC